MMKRKQRRESLRYRRLKVGLRYLKNWRIWLASAEHNPPSLTSTFGVASFVAPLDSGVAIRAISETG